MTKRLLFGLPVSFTKCTYIEDMNLSYFRATGRHMMREIRACTKARDSRRLLATHPGTPGTCPECFLSHGPLGVEQRSLLL